MIAALALVLLVSGYVGLNLSSSHASGNETFKSSPTLATCPSHLVSKKHESFLGTCRRLVGEAQRDSCLFVHARWQKSFMVPCILYMSRHSCRHHFHAISFPDECARLLGRKLDGRVQCFKDLRSGEFVVC